MLKITENEDILGFLKRGSTLPIVNFQCGIHATTGSQFENRQGGGTGFESL